MFSEKEPKIKEVDEKRFEKAKHAFLTELLDAPIKTVATSSLEKLLAQIGTTDMIMGTLNFLSCYQIKKPFKQVELEMESLLKKKSEEGNPNYSFAEEVFIGGVTVGHDVSKNPWESSWDEIYGNMFDANEISITEEEKRNEVFYDTRLWKGKLKKEIKEYFLPKLKYNDPENEKRLGDVLVVSRDLIQTL